MRTEQLSITIPKKDKKYKDELMRLKEEDALNVSAFTLNLIKRELGAV
jgi:hypothetical protein|tara:strand:+ start:601 stop:744 length:144 start_codon:yes stop_codon:yes gene_type:complete